MAARGVCVLLLLAFCFRIGSASTRVVLSLDDQVRIKEVFYNAMPFKELSTAYHAIAGLKLLKAEIPPTQDVCRFINEKVESNSIESIYYASSISKALGNCPLGLKDISKTLTESIKQGASMLTLYQAVTALTNQGIKVNADEVLMAVRATINSDEDNIIGAAYAMFIASVLPKGTDVNFIVDLIEDTVAQADETENTYLQFEGGLIPTAEVVSASYTLGTALNKAPSINEDQVIKFTNYLLTRKHVQSVENSYLVLRSLNILGNNKFHVPVVVQLHGSPLVSEDNKAIKVRVTNVMDSSLGKMTVTATSAVDSDDTTVLSNKVFKAGPVNDYIVIESDIGKGYVAAHSYELDFMSSKPSPGVYTVSVSVKPHKEDKRLIGTSDAKLKVKVVTKVKVGNVEVSVVDKEHGIKAKGISVQHPNSLEGLVEADSHQKVVMTFAVKSVSTDELLTPHQAFIRLTNHKTRQEIFFVAEPEGNKMYKFDLDVGATAKDSFGSLSGKYKMELIIGDAVIQNPFVWNVGALSLTFASEPAEPKKEKESLYIAKPQIEHMFRVAEKRPATAVSTTFTVLVLLPLLIMFALWIKIGANISNFQFSLGAIVFHIGLGAIFALYYAFFVNLNMFTTLKLLAVIGTITFLGGNSLLSSIATRRAKRS